MKTIILKIEKENLRDGSKKTYTGPLDIERGFLETLDAGTGYSVDDIDYQKGIIYASCYNDKNRAFVSGEVYDLSDEYNKKIFSFSMEEDGISCNENTLEIYIHCYETAKGLEQETTIPYLVGEHVTLKPHPYQIGILETNGEEVLIQIKDKDKTTKHLVKLHKRIERNDEYGYATGSINDPYDTHGPSVYIYLVRKNKMQ